MLSNHDVTRHVTRYGRPDTSTAAGIRQYNPVVDEDLGRRRARAAALLTMALPGAVYIYQGEDPGRDGCRVPLPWNGEAEPYGFGPDGAAHPWLPQPAAWAQLSAAVQDTDPHSMLNLYREALARRAAEPALGDGPMQWLDSAPDVLAFTRGEGFTCIINLSDTPVRLPDHAEVLVSSQPLSRQLLPTDCSIWLRTA